MASSIRIFISFIIILLNINLTIAWGGNEKVLLKDIDVLTLYNGKMTKGSRSSPVPQLECIGGGTAPCSTFKPRVVQCYNRGSDGIDVQWECKTDMDNAYRFGEIEVSCEGYNYPDDPYVLKGSCGLRYNIDYTMEGHQQDRKQHNYYGESQSSNYYGSNSHNYYNTKSSKSWNFADIIVLCAVGLMVYAFYVTCVRPSRHIGEDTNSTTNEDYPSGGGGGYGWHAPSAPPPPGSGGGSGGGGTYGFNPDYTDGASCGRNRNNHSRSSFGASGASGASGSGGGGFWTGAATGGLLGYMFGNRNTYGNRGYGGWGGGARGYGGGFSGGGFSGGGFSGGGFSGGRSSGSSGTRSSSGFGGTSRR